MEDLQKRILEILASLSTNPKNVQLYRNALGDTIPEVSEKERWNTYLEQLRTGNYESALRAHFQLLLVSDPKIAEQHRVLVRELVTSLVIDHRLREELVGYFESPRVLELDDVVALLCAHPVNPWELSLPLTYKVRALIAKRCSEDGFIKLTIHAIQKIDGTIRSDRAAYAIRDALKLPLCADAVLHVLPTLKNTEDLFKFFKQILTEEASSFETLTEQFSEQSTSLEILTAHCQITKVMVETLLNDGTESAVGQYASLALAEAASPNLVIKLLTSL